MLLLFFCLSLPAIFIGPHTKKTVPANRELHYRDPQLSGCSGISDEAKAPQAREVELSRAEFIKP